MRLRHATIEDLDELSRIEELCFPPEDACSRDSMAARLETFPDRFWLVIDNGRIVAFADGMLTDIPDLEDRMYDDASMHDPDGAWQMIFGVAVTACYRGEGLATDLLRKVIGECRAEGRKGIVLTCKERLMPLYSKVGFVDVGISESCLGGHVWHSMRLTFRHHGNAIVDRGDVRRTVIRPNPRPTP